MMELPQDAQEQINERVKELKQEDNKILTQEQIYMRY